MYDNDGAIGGNVSLDDDDDIVFPFDESVDFFDIVFECEEEEFFLDEKDFSVLERLVELIK